MRVLLLTPGTGSFFCGSCLRDTSLSRALRARGHDVEMVPLYLPFVLEDEGEEADMRVRMGGINLYLQHRLPFLRHTPLPLARALDSEGLLRWASGRGGMTDAAELSSMTLARVQGEEGTGAREIDKLCAELARRPRPEVIVLSNVMLVGLARRLRETLGAPIACTLQGEAPFLDQLAEPYRAQAWSELTERATEIDAFIPVSRWYGDLMSGRLSLAADRVHVVPNGIEVADLLALEPAPRHPTIGYFARLCADKGLQTVVDAYLELALEPRFDDLQLDLAGAMIKDDEPLVSMCRARLAAAGVQPRTRIATNVSREEKLARFVATSVFSVPATYGESFGLFVIEAMAAGLPVVLPDSGAFTELVQDTGGGLLVAPDDPGALARGLAELLDAPDQAAKLGAFGREAVRDRYTLDRMAGDVESVLASLMSQQPT